MAEESPERSCYVKRRYNSEADAHMIAARCYRDRGEWLRAYRCAECAGWHLTHTNAVPPWARWRPPEPPRHDRRPEPRTWRRKRGDRRRR